MIQKTSCRLTVLLLLLLPLLGGCEKKKKASEWLDELRPQYEPLRARLRQIAAELPPPAAAAREIKATGLNPKPVLYSDSSKGNLVFMHALELTDPAGAAGGDTTPNLILGGGLRRGLGWLAQPSVLPAFSLDEPQPKSYLAEVKSDIDPIRYLGVYRPVEYEAPAYIDEKTFRGGRVVMAFFLYDLKDGKLLAQWTQSANSDEGVSFRTRGGENPAKTMTDAALTSLVNNLKKELAAALPDQIGK